MDHIKPNDKTQFEKYGRAFLSIFLALILCVSTAAAVLLQPTTAQASGEVHLVKWSTISYGGYSTANYHTDQDGIAVDAYCVQPQASSPASGTYSTTALYTLAREGDGAQHSAYSLAKAIWYGFGGPGYDSRMWPSTDYQGNAIDHIDCYAATHIITSDYFQCLGYQALHGTTSSYQNWAYNNILAYNTLTLSYNTQMTTQGCMDNDCYMDGTPIPADKRMPDDFINQCFCIETGSSSQVIVGHYSGGWCELVKASSDQTITNGNPCYSLAGAVYDFYTDSNCTSYVGSITTDSNGYAKTSYLNPGTYYVREKTASPGYRLDGTVHPVTITSGATARLDVSEVPTSDPTGWMISKYDGEKEWSADNLPQGSATLAGAEYTVDFYYGQHASVDAAKASGNAVRSWTFATGEDGIIDLNFADKYLVDGDALYYYNGEVVFPIGSYVIYESEAPFGYKKSDSTYIVRVEQNTNGGEASLAGDTFNKEQNRYVGDGEKIIRGGVLIEKRDIETDRTNPPQGDATLENTEFSIYNESENSVFVDEVEYQPGDCVKKIYTQDGIAKTSNDALPFGSYSIVETAPSTGYLLTDTTVRYFDIAEDGEVIEFKDDDAARNRVIRGGVSIEKRDLESGLLTPLGGATLQGTEFKIYNKSIHSVVVDGVEYNPGSVVKTIYTDANAIASTSSDCLPYGSYTIVETAPSVGYLHTDKMVRSFKIREEGKIEKFSETDATSLADDDVPHNQVKRGDLEFVKVKENNMHALAGVPFKITSQTTGEWHIVVTDENGQVKTSNSWNAHSFNTNGNDAAVTYNADGTYTVDESKLDWYAGTWFGLTTEGWIVPVQDNLYALPYDLYTVEELRCSANEGCTLIVKPDVSIKRDCTLIDLGTIDDPTDQKPYIHTTASDNYDGDNQIFADDEAVINDHVEYMNLDIETTYTLRATLVYADNGDPVEGAYAETTFTPEGSNGYVNVPLTVNLLEAGGRDVVVFETLYVGDFAVTEHKDIEDNEQTVHVLAPGIGTTATDNADGDKLVMCSPEEQIKDVVTYKNLMPGREYVMSGTLMKKTFDEEGNVSAEPFVDAQGDPYTATTNFIPVDSFGTVELVFTVDVSGLTPGDELVAYEICSKNDVNIATHEDPTDEGQTVTIYGPEIGTTATDNADGDKLVMSSPAEQVKDVVVYKNLVPGRTYTMSGTLMVKYMDEYGAFTCMQFVDAEGNPYTATKEFTPLDTYGEVELVFDIDTADLEAGTELVAYEKCLYLDTEIATHEDPDDESQTVEIYEPNIHTTATDAADGDKLVMDSPEEEITDAVYYTGLVPGRNYTMTCTLMVVPPQEETSVDGTDVEGTDAEGEEGIVDTDAPIINTDVELSDIGVALVDPVELEEGIEEIADIVNGEDAAEVPTEPYPYVDEFGEPVAVTVEFMAEDSYGYVNVSFPVNASGLSGYKLVCFESLGYMDTEIATHADIDDEGQTVDVYEPEIHTTATDMADDDKEIYLDTDSVIKDVVEYKDVVPGRTYEMTCTLMLVEPETTAASEYAEIEGELEEPSVEEEVTVDGIVDAIEQIVLGEDVVADYKPYTDTEGNPVTATVEFTPEDTYGSVVVEFPVDTTTLADYKLVCFEAMSYADAEVAWHEDINDEGQTVNVVKPEIGTEAVDATDVDHGIFPSGEVKIKDIVSYDHLQEGQEYTLTGWLMDKATGQPLVIGDKKVEGTTAFTANDSSGEAIVEFTFDGTGLALDSELVAFEELYYNYDLIAEHKDIEDAGQTVKVTSAPEPTGSDYDKTGGEWGVLGALLLVGTYALGCVCYHFFYRVRDRKEDALLNA